MKHSVSRRMAVFYGTAAVLAGCGGGGGGEGDNETGPTLVLPTRPLLSIENLPRLRGVAAMTDSRLADQSSALFLGYSYIDSIGCNVLKLQLQPWEFSSGSPILPQSALRDRLLKDLEKWERLIGWCLARRIYVQIEVMHFITWPVNRVWPDDGRSLWSDATAQSELVEAIVAIAAKYQGVQGVILSPLTEPHGTTPGEIAGDHALPRSVWDGLYKRIVAAVRAIDASRWMVIEPIWSAPKYFSSITPLADSKLMYGYHVYAPHELTHQGTGEWSSSRDIQYPGLSRDEPNGAHLNWDIAQLEAYLAPAVTFGRTHQVRMEAGEFGCLRTTAPDSRARWTEDLVALLERYGHDWVYFRFEGWGVTPGYREGWAFEESEVAPILLPYFSRSRV